MDFRTALRPDACSAPQIAAGSVFYYGCLWFDAPGERIARQAWRCDHCHREYDDALECAEGALRCDSGSLLAEKLHAYVNR